MKLVAAEHEPLRPTSVELASSSPGRIISLIRRAGAMEGDLPYDLPTLDMPTRHALELRDVDPRRLESVLLTTYERAPRDFETLLGMEGVGARTLRALALVSEAIYGTTALKRLRQFAKSTEPKAGRRSLRDAETQRKRMDSLYLRVSVAVIANYFTNNISR